MEASEDQTPAETPEAKPVPKRRSGVLAVGMSRTGGDSLSTRKEMPKARATVTIPADACLPGLFDDDFELTLRSLDSKEDLKAMAKAGENVASLPFWYAFYSMEAVNGEPIIDGEAQREWLWEALGSARQIVIGTYASSILPARGSLGKAIAGIRVG